MKVRKMSKKIKKEIIVATMQVSVLLAIGYVAMQLLALIIG